MGKKAARFLQGRLLMHGGAVDTPVTFVANAGRPDQTIVASTLANMASDLDDASTRQHEAVGIYLADMAPADAGPEPTHFREDFRRTGPSNYAHGKQVELGSGLIASR